MNQMSTGWDLPEEVTVNELIRSFPDAVQVFNAFGVDACCGGAAPIRVAAERDSVDPEALLDALAIVIRGQP